MDEYINELGALTRNILDRLSIVSYEELESFVEDRQLLIDRILLEQTQRDSVKDHHRKQIKSLMDLDPLILARMNSLRLEATDWLIQRNYAKAQRNSYENNFYHDSLLLDQKK